MLALAGLTAAAPPALAAKVGGTPASALKVQVDKTKVDMKAHRLEVKMSRPAGKVKIKVYDESNAVLAEDEQDFSGRAGGTPLIVTWNPSSDAPVGKIAVRAYDARDNWVGVELFPWFVPIPHEDVNFRTGSSDIDAAEVPKLEAAYAKLEEVLAKDKQHGFSIDDFSVKETIDQGKTTTVKFKADKAGTYRVYCQIHPTHKPAELVVS